MVYSTRFLAVAVATETVTLTVPAGKVWIVRDLDVVPRSGDVAHNVEWYGSAGQIIWFWSTVPGGGQPAGAWRGRQVFYQGETMSFGGQGAFDMTCSGYELEAA